MSAAVSNTTTTASQLEILARNYDDFFLVINAIIIFLMQGGFAFLEAGNVQSKNVVHTLLINYLDLSFCAVIYWAVGYAFAFGDGNAFMGTKYWLAIGLPDDKWSHWFFQFAFAATSCTIVSGAVAERVEFGPFIVFLVITSGFIYPVVSHWVWCHNGWLQNGFYTSGKNQISFQDYAGSGVVHITGGVAALVTAAILGPRAPKRQETRAKFQPSKIKIPYHNLPMVLSGSFLMVLGFLAFNGASGGTMRLHNSGKTYAKACINTILSGCSSTLATVFVSRFIDGKWSLLKAVNGSIAGMVAICSACGHTEPWGAFFIGLVSGVLYLANANVVSRFGIDDPIDAVAVHLGGGSWGVISAALFNSEKGLLLKWNTNSVLFLLWQVVGCLAIALWVAVWSAAVFFVLLKLGVRPTMADELRGLDYPTCGEVAYPYNANFEGWIRACDNAGNYRDAKAGRNAEVLEYSNPFYVDLLKMTGDMRGDQDKVKDKTSPV